MGVKEGIVYCYCCYYYGKRVLVRVIPDYTFFLRRRGGRIKEVLI